jgi:hypothetical protein
MFTMKECTLVKQRIMKYSLILFVFSFMIFGTIAANAILNSPQVSGTTIFPSDNIWNTAVDKLPIDKNSSMYINSIGNETGLHPDFGSGKWDGGPIGIPYNVVGKNQKKVKVTFEYSDESDKGLYPIPLNPLVEGGMSSQGDRNILILDKDNHILYELYNAYKNSDGTWRAGSGAIYNLNSNALRPKNWTSADAAGLPILPGLVKYDEVKDGEINHAIRFTASRTRKAYIWPARHFASSNNDAFLPPMGQRFRLKSNFNITKFSKDTQVILKAMKKYGIILADNGSNWYISGAPDERWNNDILHELNSVKGLDFEAVDVSTIMVNSNSGITKAYKTK